MIDNRMTLSAAFRLESVRIRRGVADFRLPRTYYVTLKCLIDTKSTMYT